MKNELLAPNGKPSNLNATQYKLVRTPAFKKWFGDWENSLETASKVVDENGEPMVVYHNSIIEFNVFELKGLSDGFFFTKNIEDEEFSQKGWLKSIGLTYEQAIKKGYDLKYEKAKPYFLNIKQFFTKSNVKKEYWSTPYFENSVIEFSKRNKKNDGVEFLREIDNKQIIVAFEPNQIKLADGTNISFDANNPDIRFEQGGEITNYKEFFDELKIKDGSIYIGQKFNDVFPFLRRRKTPNDFRISVNQYNGILSRLKKDNFSSKTMKQRDLNKLDRTLHIEKTKYLAKFYLDSTGTIIDFINSNYDDSGNILLASNGKPSNLNANQYELVRTLAFKSWFGDWQNDPTNASKIVDENGEPLVCYHGTFSENVNIFDESNIGKNTGNEGHYGYGFYFSFDKLEASTYTYDTNPIILECFLNIRNPFLSSNLDNLEKYANRYGYYEEKKPVAIDSDWLEAQLKNYKDPRPYQLYKNIKKYGYEKGWELFLEKNKIDWENENFDYNRISDWFEYDSSLKEFSKEEEENNYNDEIPEFILESISEQLNLPKSKIKTIKQYTVGNYPSLLYMMDLGNRSRSLTDEIKQDGFDGIIAGSEIVVFKSNQIKLANGKNITFDSSNEDKRFDKGGQIEKKMPDYLKMFLDL